MKICITPSARADLRNIYNFIAQDSHLQARRMICKIRDLIDECGKHPYSGRIVPEFNNPILRERIIGSYRVIYRLHENLLEVITIYHSARILKQ